MTEQPKPLEKDILRGIVDYLHLRKIFAWRQNSGAVAGAATATSKRRFVRFASVDGLSDIVGVLPGGRFICIEVKRQGEKPTAKQRAFLDRVTAEGGLAIVATCLDDVSRAIDGATGEAI